MFPTTVIGEFMTIDEKAQDARRMYEARLITRKELRAILNMASKYIKLCFINIYKLPLTIYSAF